MILAVANQQVYPHIKYRVKVNTKNDGDEATDTAHVIHWNDLIANDWLAVQQLRVLSKDGLYKRRALRSGSAGIQKPN